MTNRRLGRPPSSSSVATRQRILDVARNAFADLGYGATTNSLVAEHAGITTGALYHYFDSKLAIYVAVHQHVEDVVYTNFDEVLTSEPTFVGRLFAVLENAYSINVQDPSIARFLASARVDLARHEELREALGPGPSPARRVVHRLVDHGVATGEIDPSRKEQVAALLRVLMVGLSTGVSDDLHAQRAALDAIEAVVEGRLLQAAPAETVSAPRRSGSRRSTAR